MNFSIIISFLFVIKQKAFPCIMELWNSKLYRIKCDRVIESLITIFSHLLKGETIIAKHYGIAKMDGTNTITASTSNPSASSSSGAASTSATTFEPTGEFLLTGIGDGSSSSQSSSVAATSSSSTTTNAQSSVIRMDQNPNVQTLIEMGFARDLAVHALLQTNDNVNAATEWILHHFPRYLVSCFFEL